MTDDQIKHMVDRFLSYRFPEDIQPDGGLSIRRVFNEGTPHEFKATPSGTNLLNATQATEMVRHMLEGLSVFGEVWRDKFIHKICVAVAELPDRTSPEDEPDMMLVTRDELATIIRAALPPPPGAKR